MVDARPLALFRIALGVVLGADLVHHALGLSTFYCDGGLFPRAGVDPEAWSVLDLAGSTVGVSLWFALGVAAALAFTVGLYTRVSAVVLWVVVVSHVHRVPEIHNGGDALASTLLLLCVFADVGAYASLDARRAPERAHDDAAVAPRLLQAVPAVLYAATAWQKLVGSGRGWLDGTVLFEDLHLAGWARPAGAWLGAHPSLCAAFGVATIATELAVPLLLVMSARWPRARVAAVVAHVSLQLGILATLKVGVFTNVMLAATALWLAPQWLDRVWPRRTPRPTAPAAAADRTRLQRVVDGVATGAFVAATLALFLRTPADPVLRGLGLDIDASLFTRAYLSMQWEATGVLADGDTVDPLAIVAPDAEPDDGWWNDLWMQLPYRLQRYDPLGRYVCRRYPGGVLRRWTLARVVRAPFSPGEPAPPPVRTVVLEHACSDD